MAYNYINLASNLFEKGHFHPDTISFYIAKAEELAAPNDTAMLLNLYWIKGLVAYERDEMTKAKQLFGEQLSIMEQWMKGDPLSMYTDLYQKLSEISEKQHDYNGALAYERKRNDYLEQIHDARKYEIIRELETRYDVRRKEQEVIRLTESAVYQKNIRRMYVIILILLLIAFFITAGWLRLKKKATEAQLALTCSEKNEAVLRIKLQEETLEKAKLEKYDVLLESHFKSEQISEMNNELNTLKSEQQKLNTLIDEYTGKLSEYEQRKHGDTVLMAGEPYHLSILHELYELIKRRIKDIPRQKEFIEKLATIDDAFFLRLKERANGDKLSALEIKRCVAFLIGMKTPEIVACFSVESRTIHQERHRLKVKLKIGKESSPEMFLKQLHLRE